MQGSMETAHRMLEFPWAGQIRSQQGCCLIYIHKKKSKRNKQKAKVSFCNAKQSLTPFLDLEQLSNSDTLTEGKTKRAWESICNTKANTRHSDFPSSPQRDFIHLGKSTMGTESLQRFLK